jgi:hypothetical protein
LFTLLAVISISLRPGNFATGALIPTRISELGEDVFHVEFSNAERWPLDARLIRMNDDTFAGDSVHQLTLSDAGNIVLSRNDEPLLTGIQGAAIGVCGSAWIVQFARDDAMRFYGQGEKSMDSKKPASEPSSGMPKSGPTMRWPKSLTAPPTRNMRRWHICWCAAVWPGLASWSTIPVSRSWIAARTGFIVAKMTRTRHQVSGLVPIRASRLFT